MIPHNAHIIVDIPAPHKDQIQAIRTALKTASAALPIGITLAGSSGLGSIPVGTELGLIRQEVARIADRIKAFKLEWSGVAQFPNTGVFYLAPKDRQPFDALHKAFAASRIPFTTSPFPYNPHCTLRIGPKLEASVEERILALPVPAGELLIDTISVYAIDVPTKLVNLMHRAKLPK